MIESPTTRVPISSANGIVYGPTVVLPPPLEVVLPIVIVTVRSPPVELSPVDSVVSVELGRVNVGSSFVVDGEDDEGATEVGSGSGTPPPRGDVRLANPIRLASKS